MISENFVVSNSPSTSDNFDGTSAEDTYSSMLNDLEKYMKEGYNKKLKETDLKLRNFLLTKLNSIEEKRKLLARDEKLINPDTIINDDKYQARLKDRDKMLSKKITFRRKYENIKSTEKIDKKHIVALYIVNAFLLIVLVIGCILVFKQKNLSLNGLSGILKKKNNRRNNNNNNRNNSSSLNGL